MTVINFVGAGLAPARRNGQFMDGHPQGDAPTKIIPVMKSEINIQL